MIILNDETGQRGLPGIFAPNLFSLEILVPWISRRFLSRSRRDRPRVPLSRDPDPRILATEITALSWDSRLTMLGEQGWEISNLWRWPESVN